jgi:hypothetical protein
MKKLNSAETPFITFVLGTTNSPSNSKFAAELVETLRGAHGALDVQRPETGNERLLSGHRTRLGIGRLWLDSRQGISFFRGNHGNAVVFH